MDRKIKKYTKDGWEEIPIEDLRKGDVFGIWNFIDYKNTWELYKDSAGRMAWEVVFGPYTHPIYNVWTIHVRGAGKTSPIVLWDMKHLIYGNLKTYYGMLAL